MIEFPGIEICVIAHKFSVQSIKKIINELFKTESYLTFTISKIFVIIILFQQQLNTIILQLHSLLSTTDNNVELINCYRISKLAS